MRADPGSESSLPFVSVVVSASRAENQIRQCVPSLLRMDYPTDRREILIVDDRPTARTLEILRRWPVQYLQEHRRGVGYTRNRGIRVSRGEIIAMTDPDCVVTTGWLRELVAGFAEGTVGAVAGAIVPYPPQTKTQRYAARRCSHSQLRPLNHPLRRFALTPNLAFRREVFDRIGLFDTRFPGGGWEDADLCWRFLRETDLELRYAPRAVVFHRYRATVRDFLVQHYRYGRGLALLYGKYRGELRWGWPERARAYRDLGASAWTLAKAGTRAGVGRPGDADLVFLFLDFVRQLGQRGGFASRALFDS